MALRFGIEEEYFVIDPGSREVVPRATDVVRRAAETLGERASTELVTFLAEAKTPPCDDLDKLREQIRAMRAAMASAAAAEGVRLAATGTPVLGDLVPAPICATRVTPRAWRPTGRWTTSSASAPATCTSRCPTAPAPSR